MVRARRVDRSAGARAALLLVLGAMFLVLAAVPSTRAEDTALLDETTPPPRGSVYEDPLTGADDLALHDVRSVAIHAEKRRLHVWVVFREPLKEGMFEGIDMYLDCDGNLGTGVRGADLHARVAVGSRYRPNTEAETPPGLHPAFLRRTSGHAVPNSKIGAQTDRDTFVWQGTFQVKRPRVKGRVLHYSLPLELVKRAGLRYNAEVRFRLVVEGIIAEHPIWVPYRCVDDGLAIEIDGADDDWSGGPRATDDTDDLHPAAESLDIQDLQVEHGKDVLYARLRLAYPGFRSALAFRVDSDVVVRDSLTLAFEPLGDAPYMEYREVRIPVGMPAYESEAEAWAVGEKQAEVRIARPAAQTSFRVMAWSDAWRIDTIPNEGWLSYAVPADAWKK